MSDSTENRLPEGTYRRFIRETRERMAIGTATKEEIRTLMMCDFLAANVRSESE